MTPQSGNPPRTGTDVLSVLDQAPVAVIVTDRKGTIASWNLPAAQLLGRARDATLGRPIADLAAAESARQVEKLVRQASAGKRWQGDVRLRHQDGRSLLLQLRSSPLRDRRGNQVGIIIAALEAPRERRKRPANGEPAIGTEIGHRIGQARREAGLTQQQVADRLGVTRRSEQAYESGATIPYRHLNALAETLGRTPSWFLSGQIDEPAAAELRKQLRGLLHEELVNLFREAGLVSDLEQPPNSTPHRSNPEGVA